MISVIDRLQARCRVTNYILERLASDQDAGPILQQLREGQPLPSIARKLATEDSAFLERSDALTGEGKHPPSEGSTIKSTYSEPLPGIDSCQSRAESLEIKVDGLSVTDGLVRLTEEAFMLQAEMAERADAGLNSPDEPNQMPTTRQSMASRHGSVVGEHNIMPDAVDLWSNVTDDKQLIEGLLTLYFCWEYPTFASLSKEHFYQDFRSGRRRFCSSLLVNVLLALGCNFSNRPEARTDPNDSETAGNHFFSEAKRLLAMQVHPTLTTVQALGLMSLREASHGRYSIASSYGGESIRMAVECGLHGKDVPEGYNALFAEQEVRSATFWGCFSLDQAWAMAVGRIPSMSRDAVNVTKPLIINEVEASEWTPCIEGEPTAKPAKVQPSNLRSVQNTFCELAEIVNDTLYALYTPGRSVTAQSILAAYTQYLNWYSTMPAELRLGRDFTPGVLFLHLYYHAAVLFLLRPFLRYSYLQSIVSPRDICTQAAENITSLLRSYRQLYSLRRTPSFVPYIILNTSVMPCTPLGSANTLQCIEDLQVMAINHGFAEEAVKIIKHLAARENPNALAEDNVEETTPSSTSLNFFCPVTNEELLSLDEVARI